MTMQILRFPDGFMWGTATAGHQIEGNNQHSDWWHWEQQGVMHEGSMSGQAMDYWNRYEEDHELMSQLHYPAFRLGIEWARIEPEPGTFSQEALDHYREILASLKQRGIKICLTLYHWVLPQWVAESGDWTNPETLIHFERFVRYVVDALLEFPDIWVTLNEPMMPAIAGNLIAEHPPFRKTFSAYRQVSSALLHAHAIAYHIIHDAYRKAGMHKQPMVGIAHAYPVFAPWGTQGIKGLYEKMASHVAEFVACRAWDQAILSGKFHYLHGFKRLPKLQNSVDYCGINYYFRMSLRFDSHRHNNFYINEASIPENILHTQMGWQIYPQGIQKIIRYAWKHFRKPIVITENGIADDTDTLRPAYILEHLLNIYETILDDIPVKGYFHWSFIDNFEWRQGFGPKFGLVAVDHKDKELVRQPRKSAFMYSDIIKHNGITEKMISTYAPELIETFYRLTRSG